MSLSRDWASSAESEVRVRTFFASPSRPCITSQRGDSGMARTPTARTTLGTAPIPSMNRQLRWTGSFEKARLETYPSKIPPLMKTSGKEVRKPRQDAGETSAVYTGAIMRA
uniref:Uncharacterized protein n=1 Tax=Opuntia streptacantha TaxID=393608 RepID=A0A7C9CR72_OPUST